MRNKELVEKYREVRKELHVAFMKLEKMYYKVCREARSGVVSWNERKS